MSVSLDTVIKNIETALAVVRKRMKGERIGITLDKADIQLKVTTVGGAEVGLKWEVLVPVEISAKQTTKDTQTLALSLKPAAGSAALGNSPSDELAEAILHLSKAMKQASDSAAGNFTVSSGSVALEFEINNEGKVQAIFGGNLSSGSNHSITLTFRPT
jgi:hypothetical protein